MAHTGKNNDRDIRITGHAPLDWVWAKAAEIGTYDFLDNRYAETAFWKKKS